MSNEIGDEEVERIQMEAENAAIHAPHIAGAVNPYPEDDPRAEIWGWAFRNAYARENGY